MTVKRFQNLGIKHKEDGSCEEVRIPSEYLGAVIGKHGANIKHIEETTNVTISFADIGKLRYK